MFESAPVEMPSRSGAERRVLDDRRRNPPARFGLQRRAQSNFRRHFLRGLRRFAVLLTADLGSFYIMRELVRAVREGGVLGETVAGQVQGVVPTGILNGWQFAAALFVGLLVLGSYGAGDRRRGAKRLFLACALATALPLWMTIWTRGVELVLLQYGLTTGLVWLGLLIERQLLDMVVTRVRPRPAGTLPTLFVGPAEECRQTAAKSAFAEDSEYRTVGFVDTQVPPADDALGHIVDFA